ncbi:carboxypeptidase regulatory-like domain-containing protein [Advenella sp. RU8]|uniref:carboxypeptidase regulatory-like domain-containing protein n=1 Tax=Advenella sp. RU8 TaxID=3399575 RepID=UPI003AAEF7B9
MQKTHHFESKIIKQFLLTSAIAFGLYTGTQNMAQAQVQPQTYNQSTQYITGGFGNSEQNEIKAQSSHYNLHLTFAGHEGAYLSNVQVVITDQNNKPVFEASDTGPLLYVKLPDGAYHLKATFNNQTQSSSFRIKGNARVSNVLRWPENK